MPNGGPYCCGNCGFNKAVQEMVRSRTDQKEQFWAMSHCTLRNLKITDPFWTYCDNFWHGKPLPKPGETVPLKGSVFGSGLYSVREGYVRLPWHGDSEPIASVAGTCYVCGRTAESGIRVVHKGEDIHFCTNQHYIDWWKTEHVHPEISPGGLDTPGAFYRQAAMTTDTTALMVLPCMDSPNRASACRNDLDIPRSKATELGRSAVEASNLGYYFNSAGRKVDWSLQVLRARSAKQSIAPDATLPTYKGTFQSETQVQVCNETTLQASHRLVQDGRRPLALNFANGVHPGGGFLNGSRAQEEVLCRSSALYCTLVDDPMYEFHQRRPRPDSSDWVIYSPDVPVFRSDDGAEIDHPWTLSFLTSAAPYAPAIGQPESSDLLRKRILRVLAVASAYGHEALVLGAWGCGAFANDPYRTALDFRKALETTFAGHFSDVVFAVTDWSHERKYLGPFRDVFSSASQVRS